ncbi:MAG TPA: hypothetical protein VG755_22035 [Nannocystaceae bacterium]|nr:hypothetical protein [Nannocystaceae bacterium]
MRPAAVASALLLVGCVGTNPEWNRPDGSVVTDAADDVPQPEGRDGESSSTTSSSPPDDASSSGDESSETSSTSSSGAPDAPSDGGAPPPCLPNQQICNGVCTEIDHDKHGCGVDCIDCTARFGNNAMCNDGTCEPHDGGPHDDDDDD